VEALADKFGDIPKELVITNRYDICLVILEMWCKSYIDQITTQMKQLQVLTFTRLMSYFRSQHFIVLEKYYPVLTTFYLFLLILAYLRLVKLSDDDIDLTTLVGCRLL
jgi:hypothetical protein